MILNLTPGDVTAYIQTHRAWGPLYPGKTAGFTLPVFEGGAFYRLPLDPALLQSRGIRFNQPITSPGLVIWLGPHVRSMDLAIDAAPGSTGLIAIDGPGHVSGQISMHAKDHVFILAGSHHGRAINANLWGTGTTLFFGAGGSSNSASLLVEGDHVSIQIGDDAMFADGVDIATSDAHGIFEIENPARLINMPASVLIHQHVWVGKFAAIGKGRVIGAGAIIGQRSVVTRDVPARTVAAGNPARLVREGVTWTRPWPYDSTSVRQAIEMVGSAGPT
jgi:hypothetical protein